MILTSKSFNSSLKQRVATHKNNGSSRSLNSLGSLIKMKQVKKVRSYASILVKRTTLVPVIYMLN